MSVFHSHMYDMCNKTLPYLFCSLVNHEMCYFISHVFPAELQLLEFGFNDI